MPYRVTVAAVLGLLALAASLSAAAVERQTPQWSVTFDHPSNQFPTTIVIGTRATSDGITVNFLRGAASVTAEGVRQWRADTADSCPLDAAIGYVDATERLPSGESWVMRSCYPPGAAAQRRELVRLAIDGSVLLTVNLDPLAVRPSHNPRLVAQADGVVALIPEGGRFHWLQFGNNGTLLNEAFSPLIGPTDGRARIENARLWHDGSASVATFQFIPCDISPPTACPRPASTLLRLNADGTERWRVEAGEVPVFVGFDDDGSSLIAESRSSPPLRLRHVSATGVAGTPFIAAGGEPIALWGAAGPVRGRYLAYSQTERLLIDRNGTVLARRPSDDAVGLAFVNSDRGFIAGTFLGDGALVSADDLSVLAVFDVDGIDGATWDAPANQFWSLLDDGTIYTSSRLQGDSSPSLRRARISRFAVPGSPAANIIFIGRFD